jgi:hypothetical protein
MKVYTRGNEINRAFYIHIRIHAANALFISPGDMKKQYSCPARLNPGLPKHLLKQLALELRDGQIWLVNCIRIVLILRYMVLSDLSIDRRAFRSKHKRSDV